MNDSELAAAVQNAVRGAHLNIPAEQIMHRSRAIRARRRIPALAGGLTAAAAAIAAAALVLTSGPAAVPRPLSTAGHARTVVTAAWTVREAADGTVTIDWRQYRDPAGLQQALRADGVRAIVRSVPVARRIVGIRHIAYTTCDYATTSDAPLAVQLAVTGDTYGYSPSRGLYTVIHPGAMPPGSVLFVALIIYRQPTTGDPLGTVGSEAPVVLSNNTVPRCVPNPPPASLVPAPGA